MKIWRTTGSWDLLSPFCYLLSHSPPCLSTKQYVSKFCPHVPRGPENSFCSLFTISCSFVWAGALGLWMRVEMIMNSWASAAFSFSPDGVSSWVSFQVSPRKAVFWVKPLVVVINPSFLDFVFLYKYLRLYDFWCILKFEVTSICYKSAAWLWFPTSRQKP